MLAYRAFDEEELQPDLGIRHRDRFADATANQLNTQYAQQDWSANQPAALPATNSGVILRAPAALTDRPLQTPVRIAAS
jgi:hypothetical protein